MSATTLGTAVMLGSSPDRSKEWHAMRAGRLGGSEIAAVIGLSKWESRFSLWHRKRGELGEKEANPAMTVGQYVEAATLAWWADQHPELNMQSAKGTWTHKDRDWQVANLDAWAAGKTKRDASVVEAKFSVRDDEWGDEGTDEIPPYYRAQVLWYLDVTGLAQAYVPVLFGASGRFAEYVVRTSRAEQAYLLYEGRTFLDEVEQDIRPNLDAHTATYSAVKELHLDIDGETVTTDPEVRDEWQAAKAALEAAKTEERRTSAVLLDLMGDAKFAQVDDDTYARRQPTGRGSVALYPVTPKPAKEKTA
ncbi:lambda-exonuclease family protein [Ornithinimicrobium sp. LYQ92]|uniref:lambda-exonuclease family protein n=1 Tax=Serinicoccus sp. LYQ92 TaxID=3378798 RepID=UPI003853C858